MLEKEHPTHIGVAFDPHGPTFRSDAFPDYKAQREKTPEDIAAKYENGVLEVTFPKRDKLPEKEAQRIEIK